MQTAKLFGGNQIKYASVTGDEVVISQALTVWKRGASAPSGGRRDPVRPTAPRAPQRAASATQRSRTATAGGAWAYISVR